MKNFLRIARITALTAGFIPAVSVARAFSRGYDFYIGQFFGDFAKMNPFLAVIMLSSCVIVLIFTTCKMKTTAFWRNIDFTLLAALAYFIALLCVHYSLSRFNSSVRLFLLSIIFYLALMVFLTETLARIRDKKLGNTLFWPRFFRQYPIKTPMGCIMALFLSLNAFYLFVAGPVHVMERRLNIAIPVSSVLSLAAITYFCVFMLSLLAENEKANAEKIRAERFKTELITNVSHDIRTPLTSIINYVDLLKNLPVNNKDFMEYTQILENKSARLKILIDDLMEASKAGTGNVKVEMKELDLIEIIGQMAGEFHDSFIENDLTLALRQPEPPFMVRADSRHLWRALENLFNNAVKYSLPGTRVFVEVNVHGDKPVFSMKNTSQNPIELPERSLTEQFIRGDRARQTEGSGLGLYIAKSLIELMEGSFTIRATGDLFEAEIIFC